MLMMLALWVLPLLAGCAPTGANAADPTQLPVVAPTALPPSPTANNTPVSQPAAGLTAADSGTTLYLEVGQTFTVTLEGNPSTGYTWEMSPADKPVLSQVGDVLAAPKSNLVGAPAMLMLTFRADANGSQPLALVYHRPWEKDVAPVKVFNVTVMVGAAHPQPLPPTATPKPRPTPATPAPTTASMPGWLTYTNADYGFSFRYPPEWKLQLGSGTMAGHAVLLKPDQLNAQLVVAFMRTDENAQIGRTGVGNGELFPRGTLLFAGKEINRTVLVLNGKDMTVLYNCAGCMVRGKLQFNFSLDYLGNPADPSALTASVEAQADQVVASVTVK
jgi:inhibitor of cysteine peptidase